MLTTLRGTRSSGDLKFSEQGCLSQRKMWSERQSLNADPAVRHRPNLETSGTEMMQNGMSPDRQHDIFTPEAVSEAYSRIKPVLHKTPILTSTSFNSLLNPPMSIYFKAELFQKCGVFKFRGASNAISRLSDAALPRGVATHSSGNHSAALACAARERGIKCYVVMVLAPLTVELMLACQCE